MNKCETCGKEFKNLRGLNGHIATVHLKKGRDRAGNPLIRQGMGTKELIGLARESLGVQKDILETLKGSAREPGLREDRVGQRLVELASKLSGHGYRHTIEEAAEYHRLKELYQGRVKS